MKYKKKIKGIKKSSTQKNIIEHYRETFEFLGNFRNYIYSSTFLFIFSILIAITFPIPQIFEVAIRQKLQEMILNTQGLNTLGLVAYIFVNNLIISFIALIFGVFFGIIPILFSLVNGFVLGYVAKISVSSMGLGILWKLLPHGIFELFAVLISLGIGLGLFGSLFNKSPFKNFAKNFVLAIKTFFLIILPLLLLAAFIEGILISLIG